MHKYFANLSKFENLKVTFCLQTNKLALNRDLGHCILFPSNKAIIKDQTKQALV